MGMWLCRSMFICCSANRNGSRPAIGVPRSGQKRPWVGDPPQVCRFSCPYGTWLGFSASHPALKRRAIFRTSSGRWVRLSCPLRLRSGQALRDMVGFLAIVPGVETRGYFQDVLRRLGAVQQSPFGCAEGRLYGTGLGFSASHPALKGRAIFRTSSGGWVRFSRPSGTGLGFLPSHPALKRRATIKTSSGRCALMEEPDLRLDANRCLRPEDA